MIGERQQKNAEALSDHIFKKSRKYIKERVEVGDTIKILMINLTLIVANNNPTLKKCYKY